MSTEPILPKPHTTLQGNKQGTAQQANDGHPNGITEQQGIAAPAVAQGTHACIKDSKRFMLHKTVSGRSKAPYYVNGTPRRKPLDTEQDWAQLATYDEAFLALQTGDYDGLGIALGPDGTGNFYQGVDFDKVKENELEHYIDTAPGYVEISPSGNGFHAIGYGEEFPTLGSRSNCGVEAYARGRYFTFTEQVIRDGPLVCLSNYVEQIIKPIHDKGDCIRRLKLDPRLQVCFLTKEACS